MTYPLEHPFDLLAADCLTQGFQRLAQRRQGHVGVAEEIAAGGAVATGEPGGPVRPLGLTQVQSPGGEQGLEVAERGPGQQSAQGLEEGLQAWGESVTNQGRPRRLDAGTTRIRISRSRPWRYAKGNPPAKKHSV